ncbi:MAG: peptidase M16 [Rhodospirillaceae bacterium]|nr:peptidase M16 [Rhodospirillaceae bacterium]
MTQAIERVPAPPLLILLALMLAPLPAKAFDIQRVISPGGIEAWLVEDHSLPIVSARFLFPGGAATDPAGKEGLANMVSGLLDEGAGELESEVFQTRLADQSISLSFNATFDGFGGQVKTLTRNRDEAFDLLRLAVTSPRFDAMAVERVRAQIQAGLAAGASNPNRIAQQTFRKAVFDDHPYSRPVTGTPESVAAITQADLRKFVSRRLARSELIIGVVGDVTAAELGPLLDATFVDLPERAEAFTIPQAELGAAGEVIVVERDIPQSRVVFGHRGLYRDDPDYYAAILLNHVLGGGNFTSRLYDEVREKRGLAYSVFSYLLPLQKGPLWMGGAGTENGAVAKSVDLIREQWVNVQEFAISQEELDRAKANLIGSFGLRFDSTMAIAGTLVAVQFRDLGIDFLNRRNDLIEAVTLEEVRRVAQKVLDPAALTVVVVGRPEGLAATRTIADDG